eukprot:2321672-Heterocapsa_arctica.AAC.1
MRTIRPHKWTQLKEVVDLEQNFAKEIKGIKKWGGLVSSSRTDRPTLSPERSNEEEITVSRRILARTDSSERSKANTP